MASANFETHRKQLVSLFKFKLLEASSFQTITQARALATTEIGEPIRPGEPLAKALEEAIEQAVILSAKQIISQERFPFSGETYDKLVDLYNRQPTLGTRTSNSVEMQAYSTIIPLAFVAGKLAGIDADTSVYEPTAGRGALLMLGSASKIVANELDPLRAKDLEAQGYQVSQHDATAYRPTEEFDVVIANPPFGWRRGVNGLDKFQIGAADTPIETTEIDQAISWKALEAMKNEGSAVLIIGSELGNDAARLKKYNSARSRKFFFNLYRQYHVADHFTVDGKLYSKQGAAFPVDVIVIRGRKQTPYLSPNMETRNLPGADVPRVITSFESLKEVLSPNTNEQYNSQALHTNARSLGTGRRGQRATVSRTSVARNITGQRPGTLPEADRATYPLDDSGTPWATGLARTGMGEVRPSPEHRDFAERHVRRRTGVSRAGPSGESANDSSDSRSRQLPTPVDSTPRSSRNNRTNSYRNLSRSLAQSTNDVTSETGMETPEVTTAAEESKNISGQVPYIPKSKGTRLNSFVPQNLERPIQNALDHLEQSVGDIDSFVADALNYGSIESMHVALAAEQVDGVALAIRSIQNGNSALIGDDTGLGKGRQMAAAIKYAIETGRTPIFITKDPGLYADIVRDLHDIGMTDIRPFMTNSDQEIPLPSGRTLKTSRNSHSKELTTMLDAGELSSKYNMVFSTYSQLQAIKKRTTDRRRFLRAIAPGAVLALDEAHDAGGSDTPSSSKSASNRAEFTREMVAVADGVFYSSATATKRPEVMDLYLRRMNAANVSSVSGLQETLSAGGNALQQIANTMMAEDGQYIRRERTFDGVDVESMVVKTNHADADKLGEVMRSIIAFDQAKKDAVRALNEEARKVAKSISGDSAIGDVGAKSTNFSSIMWNVVSQTALARKADATADLAISAVEAGEKPFIGLSNTMGSFIGQFAQDSGIKDGDPIDVNFQDVLWRYLERSRDITIRNYNGSAGARRPMTDDELGPSAVKAYEEATTLINQADFEKMPISPIDWIRYRVENAGYSFGELTGRDAYLQYNDDGNAIYRTRNAEESSKAAKIAIIKGFNNGTIDVGIGNRSASTGYSMHTSKTFADQRRRHFFIVQPEGDINVFKQFLGRFHRTGQVNAPKISLISGDTPDEKRPTAVLGKKLGTLKANTVAARKGGIDFDNIPDFFNAVGDEVVSDILRYDPDLNERLFHPIHVSENNTKAVEGAVGKVTGKLPILTVREQEAFYAELDELYAATIERYEAMGENPLEASGIDLDARTLARVEVVPPVEGLESAFAEGIYAEIADVKVQSKPKTQLEVINDVRATLEMPLVRDVSDHSQDEANALATNLVQRLQEQARLVSERYQQTKILQYEQEEPDLERRLGKIDKLENRIKKQLEALTHINRLSPGQKVRMTGNGGRLLYGVVTDIRKRGKSLEALSHPDVTVKENVVIPSRWDVVIAIADTERQLTLPLSKVNPANESRDSFTVARALRTSFDEDIYKLFDQRQLGQREQRILLKGNLLRTGGTPYKEQGQIVVASMSNGQREAIMLMDKGFDPEKEMQAAPVVLPDAGDVREFFDLTENKGIIKTTNEAITLKFNRADQLVIQTGKAKKGVYLDKKLLAAIGGEFTSVADRMEAAISPFRIDDVMEHLATSKGMKIAAFTHQSIAREMLGIELPGMEWANDVQHVLGQEALPVTATVENLEAVRSKLQEATENRANVLPNGLKVEPSAPSRDESTSEDLPSGDRAFVDDLIAEHDGDEEALINDVLDNNIQLPSEAQTDPLGKAEEVVDEQEPQAEKTASLSIKKPSPNRSRLKAEQQIFEFLTQAGLVEKVMQGEGFHLKIQNEPWLPLVVESHNSDVGKTLYFTHYYEQNGDRIHDGEMVFEVMKSGQLALSETAVQDAFRGGEIRNLDRSFAVLFSRNIIEQGFAEAAVQQIAAESKALDRSQDDHQPSSPPPSLATKEVPASPPINNTSENKPAASAEVRSPASQPQAPSVSTSTQVPTKEDVIRLVKEGATFNDILGSGSASRAQALIWATDEGYLKASNENTPIEWTEKGKDWSSKSENSAQTAAETPFKPESEPRQPATHQRPNLEKFAAYSPSRDEHKPEKSIDRQIPNSPNPSKKVYISAPRAILEKAAKAAIYVGNTDLRNRLKRILTGSTRSSATLTVPQSIKSEIQSTINSAKNKQQQQFAQAILPSAIQLLNNANLAGLSKSGDTDLGKVTVFEGENYSVRCRENEQRQEIKVLCHRTNGMIHAINGTAKKSEGLKPQDQSTIQKFASLSPQQLKQAIQGRTQATAQRGCEQ